MDLSKTNIDEEVFERMKERALSESGDELSEKAVVDMMIEATQSKARLDAESIRAKAQEKVALIQMATAVLGMVAYSYFQGRVLHFEETGSIRSFAGRGLQLPKFMK